MGNHSNLRPISVKPSKLPTMQREQTHTHVRPSTSHTAPAFHGMQKNTRKSQASHQSGELSLDLTKILRKQTNRMRYSKIEACANDTTRPTTATSVLFNNMCQNGNNFKTSDINNEENNSDDSNQIVSKYEKMGKLSYRKHFQNKYKSKLARNINQTPFPQTECKINSTECTNDTPKDKLWSQYHKYMYPSRLKMKIRERLLNNRMASIVLYLGTLSRKSRHRNIVKKRFIRTIRSVLFQTDLYDIQQRLANYYQSRNLQMTCLQFSNLPTTAYRYQFPGKQTSFNPKSKFRNKTTHIPSQPINSFLVYASALASNNNSNRNLGNKAESIKNWLIMFANQSNVFKLFKKNELISIFGKIQFKMIHYRAGQTIYSESSQADCFYTVLHGNVSCWVKKYETFEMPGNPEFVGFSKNDNPFSHPTLQSNKNCKLLSAMAMFKQHFEKCMQFGLGGTFGELGFENKKECYESIAIAKEHCIVAAIKKSDYIKYFRDRVIASHHSRLQLFEHFGMTAGNSLSLERCVCLQNISKVMNFDRAELICPTMEYKVNKSNYIYIIREGSVSAYLSNDGNNTKHLENNRNQRIEILLRHMPLLRLGKGELIDPRSIISVSNSHECAHEFDINKYNNLYFIANSSVIVDKINIQSFFRIGKFDFWSVLNASKNMINFIAKKIDTIESQTCQNKIESASNTQRWKKRNKLDTTMPELLANDGYLDMFVKLENMKYDSVVNQSNNSHANMYSTSQDKQATNNSNCNGSESLNLFRQVIQIPTLRDKLPPPLEIVSNEV